MEILCDKARVRMTCKDSKRVFNQQTRRAISRTRLGVSYRIRSNERDNQGLEKGSNDSEEAKGTSYMSTSKQTSRPEGKASMHSLSKEDVDLWSLKYKAEFLFSICYSAVLEFPPTTLHALKTTGLHKTPQSGGVQNATARCDLPSPAVAVRNLVEQAQFAHLCTIMSNMHHRRAGYPFGTVVDFAADGAGHPIFCLSPLAIQTRNIMEDPRCSLVMQMPGWSGLANARVTMFGDVYKLPKELQGAAADIFHRKLSSDEEEETRFVSGNAIYFRMDKILDIYFVGGFGTVQWVGTEEYTRAQPDKIVLEHPNHTLQVLNQTFSGSLRDMLSQSQSSPVDDAAFISIDRLGADVRIRRGGDYSVERFGFDSPVETLDDVLGKLNGKFKFKM